MKPLPKLWRHADGTLYHLRAIVDRLLVCRHWRPAKQRWQYEVVGPYAVHVGLLMPGRDGCSKDRCRALALKRWPEWFQLAETK